MELTQKQKDLVVDHLNLVPYIIKKYIRLNDYIDMSYEDLMQEGNLALCEAAMKYNYSVKFNTFAEIVIRNKLFSYCKKSVKRKSGEIVKSREDMDNEFMDEQLTDDDIDNKAVVELLEKLKKDYSGVKLKGIEAIALKIVGVSGKDIAKIYGITPNNLSAWIAKAKKELYRNEELMQKISCKF